MEYPNHQGRLQSFWSTECTPECHSQEHKSRSKIGDNMMLIKLKLWRNWCMYTCRWRVEGTRHYRWRRGTANVFPDLIYKKDLRLSSMAGMFWLLILHRRWMGKEWCHLTSLMEYLHMLNNWSCLHPYGSIENDQFRFLTQLWAILCLDSR